MLLSRGSTGHPDSGLVFTASLKQTGLQGNTGGLLLEASNLLSTAPGIMERCPTVKLKHSGLEMPILGFGVYKAKDPVASVLCSLQNGYRHIDSARVYRNEPECAEAIRQAVASRVVVCREDVWLTSKINSREHGGSKTRKAINSSCNRIEDVQPLDLMLLHDACSGKERRLHAWKELQQAKAEGRVRSIGVSNFSVKHLEEVEKSAGGGVDVNQIELHPWDQQRHIVDYCRDHGIVVQAYCPLVQGQKMGDPTLLKIAQRHGHTAAQVLIRWSIQKGFVPLPKSDNPGRIAENAQVFDWQLDQGAMEELDSLDQGSAGAVSWNPVHVD